MECRGIEMKRCYITMLGAVLLIAGTSLAQANKSPIAPRSVLSSQFRTKAWRAMDAVFDAFGDCVNGKEVSDSTVRSIHQTVNEAKYVASTPTDRRLLLILDTAVGSLTWQMAYTPGSVEWKIERDRGMQCHIEAVYYISPGDLSPEGKDTALDGTCTKATKEWGDPLKP
jgi:hypothetical protein